MQGYDVIVIGSGAGGLVCAIGCARANRHVIQYLPKRLEGIKL